MSILYLNQILLLDPRLKPIIENYPQYPWDEMATFLEPQYMARTGPAVSPVKNLIVDRLGMQMPIYNPNFNKSFADITDSRCYELLQTYTELPWLIHWSGGVDSTTMLTSILKNTSKADRENMYVCLNRISIFENPRFYYEHIEPNFKIIDSSLHQLSYKQMEDYHLILGEFNDQLHSGSISVKMIHTDPEALHTNFFQHPDKLIDYLEDYFKNRTSAEWFFQKHVENIQAAEIPMTTYYDFFWWHFFNNVWAYVKVRAAFANTEFSPAFFELYLSRFISWYETEDYQKWSMIVDNRTPPVHIGKCKPDSKKYIYDYNHDEYYYEFKTKMTSVSNLTKQEHRTWFCLLDDMTTLTLDNDLEQIVELLPDFII